VYAYRLGDKRFGAGKAGGAQGRHTLERGGGTVKMPKQQAQNLNTAPLTSKTNECERADDDPVAGCAVFDS
jgi:hypothetical protein